MVIYNLCAVKQEQKVGAPKVGAWQWQLLVVDDQPDLRTEFYAWLEERGADVDIETSLQHALTRMRHSNYTFVFVPVAAAARLGMTQISAMDMMERWAAREAPNYQGRFLYYGAKGTVATLSRALRTSAERPVVIIPTDGGRAAIERAAHDIEEAMTKLGELLRTKRRKR